MKKYKVLKNMGGQFGMAGATYETADDARAAQLVAAGYLEPIDSPAKPKD